MQLSQNYRAKINWKSTEPADMEENRNKINSRGYLSGCCLVFIALLSNILPGFSQVLPFTQAKWITTGYAEDTVQVACPVFKKGFELSGTLKSATLSVTALGLYEARLNGKKVGKDYFTPGFTNYNKRLQYQEYDVTGLVQGKNELRVTVGEGWYRGVFRGAKVSDNYGSSAGLLLELTIVYVDGRKEKIVSNGSWSCAAGPIRYSAFYDGELYDAAYIPACWSAVKVLQVDRDVLVPSAAPAVRAQEEFKPAGIFKTPAGEWVVDFGQNLAGFVRLKIRGKNGDTVRLFHAEVLDQAGNFYTGNLREARAMDSYVLSGNGLEVFEPHFTYHGFRYVKVEGFNVLDAELTAVALYSDLKKTGSFSCSDSLINRLQKNIEWSMNSNFMDIPTDCPQRSERLGWLGDAQVFAPTASFLRDTRSFYSKWLKDVASEQGKNGGLPVYVPTVAPFKANQYGVAGWGDAAVMIPWTVYSVYNDTTVLRAQYGSMKAWVDYVTSQSPGGLWKARGYGDWYAPGDSTSIPYIDQCFYAHSLELMLRTAKVLNKTADIPIYEKLLLEVKSAFLDTYVSKKVANTDTQTAYVLALAFELLPEEMRAGAAAKLVALIGKNGDHLATGFLGTPHLLQVLSDYGYSDVAYKLLNQQSYPSWLYPVKMGATTIWEKWDGIDAAGTVQASSYNHYAYGAVGSWLYEYVAGIRCAAPGYSKIIIRPLIGGGLSWAKGVYLSDYGRIVSEWKIKKDKVLMKVEIPAGTTAAVVVPGRRTVSVGAGKYTFTGSVPVKSHAVSFAGHQDWNFTLPLSAVLVNEQVHYPAVKKLLVISDVEGEFEVLRDLLIHNKVIDAQYNWTFGKGHLVVAGDLFDRGEQVEEVLWLLYKLEGSAKLAGGYVHTLLGNHDIMNLAGDFRYVQPQYFAEAKASGLDYKSLYSPDTELGRWLRTKNVVEQLGETLFAHAGFSPEVMALNLSLEELNKRCRQYYGVAKKDLPDRVKVLFGKDAPFWYRGYFMPPQVGIGVVDHALEMYGANLIVVGHTIVKNRVAFYYSSKVLGVDVDAHTGKRAGALFLAGKWYSVDGTGKKVRLFYHPDNDAINEKDIL